MWKHATWHANRSSQPQPDGDCRPLLSAPLPLLSSPSPLLSFSSALDVVHHVSLLLCSHLRSALPLPANTELPPTTMALIHQKNLLVRRASSEPDHPPPERHCFGAAKKGTVLEQRNPHLSWRCCCAWPESPWAALAGARRLRGGEGGGGAASRPDGGPGVCATKETARPQARRGCIISLAPHAARIPCSKCGPSPTGWPQSPRVAVECAPPTHQVVGNHRRVHHC